MSDEPISPLAADPAATPAPPAAPSGPTAEGVSAEATEQGKSRPAWQGRQPTRLSGLGIGVILSAVVLIFLLIFILQNGASVEIKFLGASGTLPVGVALLLAAICGVLLVAIPATGRSLQQRRAARRQARKVS